jgi:carbonic anhydrase/acetyltransferase-like protein (isoleucine patch superfamily)
MRKVIIRKTGHIDPFNEPASRLRVLNKPLWQWQRDLLAPYCKSEVTADSFDAIPISAEETLIVSDNLWFDELFLKDFVDNARSKNKPVRAAFRGDDPAYLQQGLGRLSPSYERRGELYFVDLWYFPAGTPDIPRTVEPVIISSEAHEVGYYHIPTFMSGDQGDLVWWLPERAVCAVDSWIHVFFINIVFGVFTRAYKFERQARDPMFRLRARWRAFAERRPLLASSAYVRVGKNCSIDPSTVFHGPVFIGNNVTIGPGCVISQCIIGDNVTLAHDNHFHMCALSDGCFFPWGANAYFTVFMEGSSAMQNTSIEMSVIGRHSSIGAGTVFTTFNVLPTPLKTLHNHHLVEIDIPVLGACVGHNCRLGAGLVVYPARVIESDVVLIASPTRRVIMKNIAYEESDHHFTRAADSHPRRYPREYEQELESQW